MAAAAGQSGPKGSKKKPSKAADREESPDASLGSGAAAESYDDGPENSYIKELQKNIRNLNKKISNASKTDTLLSQHAGKSLDDLIASKVINADQKAQIQKKPALQAQLALAEEQLVQYQKVHEQYRTRAAADKVDWEKTLQMAKADAVSEVKLEFERSMRSNLLTLSQFLRLAAYRREEASNAESDESQAIEGVLLAIYAGDDGAVSSMLKLVDGTDDKILSVPGEQLQTTYAAVKTLAQQYKTPSYDESAPRAEAEAAVDDPALAHAADATEAEAVETTAPDGQLVLDDVVNGLANANVVDNADAEVDADAGADIAGAAAAISMSESQFGTEPGHPASQEWADMTFARHASDESSHTVTGSPVTTAQSWADDQPEPTKQPIPADSQDGFHQVQRNRSRQEREGNLTSQSNGHGNSNGNWRGRGRGDHRGRGGNRDGRGRGRGRGGKNGAVATLT